MNSTNKDEYHFSKESEQVEDKLRSGAPDSANKQENIEEEQRLVIQDCQVTVWMISKAVGT